MRRLSISLDQPIRDKQASGAVSDHVVCEDSYMARINSSRLRRANFFQSVYDHSNED